MTTADVRYRHDAALTPDQLAALFRAAGLRRPVDEPERLAQMIRHANLTITAWSGDRLIGVARALTDFAFCCYLSDLAVDKAYQRRGIGAELIGRIRQAIGPNTTLLLLSAPEAMDYYPKVGFKAVDNGWIIERER